MRWKYLETYLRQSLVGPLVPGAADIRIVAPTGTGQPAAYWEQQGMWSPDMLHKTVTNAYGECTSGRNDVVLLSPDNHSQVGTALTWAKNMTHLIGMGPSDMMLGQRPRLGHSTTIATFMTVSGYGNLLANFGINYGVANTDLCALHITGARNTLKNLRICPTFATAMDNAAFACLKIDESELTIKNCVIGTDATVQSAGALISFPTAGVAPRVVFDNCVLIMRSDNAAALFVKTAAGLGEGYIAFKNTQLINIGTALTYGIDGTGLGNCKMIFDANSFFVGVTDVVAAAAESSVLLAPSNLVINQVNTASVALYNGIACSPDVS